MGEESSGRGGGVDEAPLPRPLLPSSERMSRLGFCQGLRFGVFSIYSSRYFLLGIGQTPSEHARPSFSVLHLVALAV